MNSKSNGGSKLGIARAVIIGIIVVIIIIAGVGIFVATSTSHTTTSTTSSTSSSSSSSSSQSQSSSSSSSSVATGSSSSSSSSSSQQSTTSSSTSTSSTSSSSSSSSGGTLVFDDFAYPEPDFNNLRTPTLNPYPDWLESVTYQTLVDFNATAEQNFNQLQVLPDLASNWTVSSNGEVYNFTIRPGVTFSNGDRMNSYQVWAQFYMLYDLEGNFSTFWLGMPIFNFSHVAFGTGTLNVLNTSGLSTPSSAALAVMQNSSWPVYTSGPNNVIFQTDTPFSFFLPSLTGWTGFQMDSQYIIEHGGPGVP